MDKSQVVYVVSAPSGTGKTTLNRRLTDQFSDFEISVSYTTRPKRPAEVEGVHYHFVSGQEFTRLVDQNEMLEFANVFGTLYGTARGEVARIQESGKKVILEIDVQGWMQAKGKLDKAVAIFILPPSIKVLWERLSGRGTESLEKRWKRLQTAKNEIESAALYNVFIINEDLDIAYQDLVNAMVYHKRPALSLNEGLELCQKLLAEFEEPWIDQIYRQLSAS